jgi:hypothetical protein
MGRRLKAAMLKLKKPKIAKSGGRRRQAAHWVSIGVYAVPTAR